MTIDLKHTKEVRRITSGCDAFCREPKCSFKTIDDNSVSAEIVNHMIAAHSFRILFIGTETEFDDDDRLLSYTVTVLGK
jgi:hypothetical protein